MDHDHDDYPYIIEVPEDVFADMDKPYDPEEGKKLRAIIANRRGWRGW